MILTGRAKYDFYVWLCKKYPVHKIESEKYFGVLYQTFQDALIIEWFDSVLFYIETAYYTNHKFSGGVELPGKEIGFISIGHNLETRKEAITEAIIKANEIYNNLNK